MRGRRAVFLDRDGTINVDKRYLYRAEDFEYLDGAVEGLRHLGDMGFILVLITNQSGIARGYYSEDDYKKLDAWLKADLKSKGVTLEKSYFCPHHPSGTVPGYARACECRKPKTGLFWKAAGELGIDMDRSYAIGDRMRDLSICGESGVKGFLITDTGEAEQDHIIHCPDWKSIVESIRTIEGSK